MTSDREDDRPMCATCPHCFRLDGEGGACIRFPPTGPGWHESPRVTAMMTCGEHPLMPIWIAENFGKATTLPVTSQSNKTVDV